MAHRPEVTGRRRRLASTVGVGLLAAGCAGGEPDQHVVRDSAGIRIVENRRPAWSEREGWRVDTAPSLEIGGDDTLGQLGAPFRLRDGRIVVAHIGGHEILVYSAEGKLLTRFGRRGRGPGEFLDISRVLPTPGGDSILVSDLLQNRVSIFDTHGILGRSGRAATDVIQAPLEGVFRDGSFLMANPIFPDLDARGLVRGDRILRRQKPGAQAIEVARMRATDTYYQELPTGEVDWRPPFFAHGSHYALWQDRLFWAETDAFQIHRHGPDGSKEMIILKEHPVRNVTDADVEPLIEQRVLAVRDENARPLVRRILSNLPKGTLPVFGGGQEGGPPLLIDDDGNIWVREFTMPGDDRNARLVFDSAGVWLGTVQIPSGFGPRHIGSDFVLGKVRDDDDVERVVMYTLRKRR